jgi:hypothetical protein
MDVAQTAARLPLLLTIRDLLFRLPQSTPQASRDWHYCARCKLTVSTRALSAATAGFNDGRWIFVISPEALNLWRSVWTYIEHTIASANVGQLSCNLTQQNWPIQIHCSVTIACRSWWIGQKQAGLQRHALSWYVYLAPWSTATLVLQGDGSSDIVSCPL